MNFPKICFAPAGNTDKGLLSNELIDLNDIFHGRYMTSVGLGHITHLPSIFLSCPIITYDKLFSIINPLVLSLFMSVFDWMGQLNYRQ